MDTTVDPRATPQAARLAAKLMGQFFGPVVEKAAAALLKHGRCSLRELVASTELAPADTQAALTVLLQLDCAAAYLGGAPPAARGAPPRREHLYEPAADRMLHLLRLPRLFRLADEALPGDALAARALRLLAERGRLRFDQLAALLAGAAPGGEAPPPGAAEAYAALAALVGQRFAERVPPAVLPPPEAEAHAASRRRRAAPKPGTVEYDEADARQKRALQRTLTYDQRHELPALEELLPPPGGGAGAGAGAGPPGAPAAAAGGRRGKRKAPAAEAPAKRARHGARVKREDLDAEDASATESDDDDDDGGNGGGDGRARVPRDPYGVPDIAPHRLQWRVCFDEAARRLRNAAIAEHVRRQDGDAAGAAVAALLGAGLAAEARRDQGLGASGGGAAIVVHPPPTPPTSAAAAAAAAGAPAAATAEALATLAAAHGVVYPAGDPPAPPGAGAAGADGGAPPGGGALYSVDVARACGLVRNFQTMAVVRDRFGGAAMRLWRLLIVEGQLEQRAAADAAMVGQHEARRLLYAMLRAGFLQLQEVPRSGERAPSRTFYTWRARQDAAAARIGADLYRAAGNAHARLGAELRAQAALLARVAEVEAGTMRRDQVDLGAVARLHHTTAQLQATLQRLDEMLVFFEAL